MIDPTLQALATLLNAAVFVPFFLGILVGLGISAVETPKKGTGSDD